MTTPIIKITRYGMADTPGTTVRVDMETAPGIVFSCARTLAAGESTRVIARDMYATVERASRVFTHLCRVREINPADQPRRPYLVGGMISEAEAIARCEMPSKQVAMVAARVGGVAVWVGRYRAMRAGEREAAKAERELHEYYARFDREY